LFDVVTEQINDDDDDDKNTKKGQNSTKRCPLVHIVELSAAAVKVDIKVINASLTQNQCLRCVTPPLMHAC